MDVEAALGVVADEAGARVGARDATGARRAVQLVVVAARPSQSSSKRRRKRSWIIGP
jgi:hypothetical protein